MSFQAAQLFTRNSVRFSSIVLVLALSGGSTDVLSYGWLDKLKAKFGADDDQQQVLSNNDIGGGLKEALRVGTQTVVENLGAADGFNLDELIHITLPDKLEKVKDVLAKVQMDSMLIDLELQLNRAAEGATPRARELFMQAINDMTLDDVMAIYKGPDDSATQYFESKMSASLATEMMPVVDESLANVGAIKTYEKVMQQYSALPFVPKIETDLSTYVVQKAMDGIFFYLAKEEAAIRSDPVKRTTDLLKRVFGS